MYEYVRARLEYVLEYRLLTTARFPNQGGLSKEVKLFKTGTCEMVEMLIWSAGVGFAALLKRLVLQQSALSQGWSVGLSVRSNQSDTENSRLETQDLSEFLVFGGNWRTCCSSIVNQLKTRNHMQ